YLGLCRYDGKNTFVYNGSNGLPENAVYSVTEDTEGRMWILTSKNRILCIENGKIHEPEFSKEFTQRKELNVVNFALHLKLADGGKEIIINTFYNTFIIDPKSGKIHLFDSDHTYPDHTKKEKEQTRINQLLADSRLSALQAQMNPHFVFNSINSIQNFILKKDIDHAYDYLTKFSKLIRLVLQNSRKKEISVQEDLEVLRLYIMLEQLRFNNRFEYHERISDDIDPHNTLIPPMLIQPYIENAIWHGIMPLEGKRTGVITLRMDIEQQTIKIVIEDNGVGRKSKEQHSGHESLSMKVTEERLSIVNSLYKDDKPSLQVIDLTDENGTPAGTRIELKIPLEKDDV
ncbi:histidine kinase, partial [Ancylostoma ceylanicum]